MTLNANVSGVAFAQLFDGLDTVPALLARRVALTPNALAHYTKDASGTWQSTTWAQFAAVTDCVAEGFMEVGLAPGARMAILAGTSQDWEICQMAAFQIGVTVIGIDPYYPAQQTNRIIAELNPAVLVVGEVGLLQ